MILKASQRGGAKQLGQHLLKTSENEHVEVHEVRGFLAQDLLGALREAEAVSQGTRCKQFMFSVSLNPPERESVRVEVFEQALAAIEERNGLIGQPRVVVFHEKEGRRHCHAVWSRIDADTMTAKPLPFFKTKLREVSKQLYLENGWKMPRGLMDSKERDPRNFTLSEWQQAKRAATSARDLKSAIQECWAVSDSRASFARALEERGLFLAKGDRRAHVAITHDGEVFSVARIIGKKVKEVAARLGPADDLHGVDETKARIASEIAPRLKSHLAEAKANAYRDLGPLEQQRLHMRGKHQTERSLMDHGLKVREEAEMRQRTERLRSGLAGIWDRLRGEYARRRKQNELEALFALQRDRAQRHALVQSQLAERQELQARIRATRDHHAQELRSLHRDAAIYRSMAREHEPDMRDASDRLDELRHGTRRDEKPAGRSPDERLRALRGKDRQDPEPELER